MDLVNGFWLSPTPLPQTSTGRRPFEVTETHESFSVRADLSAFGGKQINDSVDDPQVLISTVSNLDSKPLAAAQIAKLEAGGKPYGAIARARAVDDARGRFKCEDGAFGLILPKRLDGNLEDREDR